MLDLMCTQQHAWLGTIQCVPQKCFIRANNITDNTIGCNKVPVAAKEWWKEKEKYKERERDCEYTALWCTLQWKLALASGSTVISNMENAVYLFKV